MGPTTSQVVHCIIESVLTVVVTHGESDLKGFFHQCFCQGTGMGHVHRLFHRDVEGSAKSVESNVEDGFVDDFVLQLLGINKLCWHACVRQNVSEGRGRFGIGVAPHSNVVRFSKPCGANAIAIVVGVDVTNEVHDRARNALRGEGIGEHLSCTDAVLGANNNTIGTDCRGKRRYEARKTPCFCTYDPYIDTVSFVLRKVVQGLDNAGVGHE